MLKPYFKFNPGWYLLYCRPKQEKKIAIQLSIKSVETFVPEMQNMNIEGSKRKQKKVIMFPSYVFVYLEDIYAYFHVKDTSAVVDYVKFNKVPVIVDDQIISSIRTIIDMNIECELTTESFEVGHQYLIEEGPLCGFNCEVVRYNGQRKGLVRVLLLEKNILVDLPLFNLKKPFNSPT